MAHIATTPFSISSHLTCEVGPRAISDPNQHGVEEECEKDRVLRKRGMGFT